MTGIHKASYVGFWVMVGLGIAAFTLTDAWSLRVLVLVAALAVGWCSLGLYARVATASAQRARLFDATPEDEDLLRELGRGRAHEKAFRRAPKEDDTKGQ